jgi:multiple sugar transport system permease protein
MERWVVVADTSTAELARERVRRRPRSHGAALYLFISPWLLGFLLLTAFPLGYSLTLSLTTSEGFSVANFARALFDDQNFWISVGNTLVYTLGSVILGLAVSLGLAMLITKKYKARALLQAAVFFPSVAAGVGVYLLWGWLLDTTVGPINYVLQLFGLPAVGWFTDPSLAMLSLILMSLFFYGTQTVVFVAGLKNVPTELYEAASLDGAGRWKRFTNVTLPMISPSTFFNIIVSLIAALQLFAQPYLMTKGGPGRATYSMGMYIYDSAFKYGRFDYAATLAWILFVLTLLIAGIVIVSSRKWVHYDVG